MSLPALSLSLPPGEYQSQRSRLDRGPGTLLRCNVVTFTDHTEGARVFKLARACLLADVEDDGASDVAHKIMRGMESSRPPSVRMNLLNAVSLGGAVLLRAEQTVETGVSANGSTPDEGLLVPLAEAARRSLEPYPSTEEAAEAIGYPLPPEDIELLPVAVAGLRVRLDAANRDLFPVRIPSGASVL